MLPTEPHFKYKDSERLKEWRKIYHANINQKKAGSSSSGAMRSMISLQHQDAG